VHASALTQVVLGADDTNAGAAGFYQNSTYTFFVSTDVADPAGGTAPSNFATVTFKVGGTDDTANANSADQLNAAVQAFNHFDLEAHPSHRERMQLILRTPTLQAHSVLRYGEWRRVIAER
jgi:hypothetical protein